MRRTVGVLVALSAGACGDGTGISPEGLAGTWQATVLEFTNQANLAEVVEAVNLGGRMTLTFRADGTYTSESDLPGQGALTTTGTFTVNGTLLTFDAGTDAEFETIVARNDERLTLQAAESAFDFDGDGATERAALRAVFERG